MAINDSFNLNNALTSQSYAYKCWYNYNYCGNTMGIDSKSMSEINQNWSGELANWRATASNDENAYEIEDDDYSSAKNRGKEIGKDKTGYDGGKGGMIARDTIELGGAVAGAAMTTAPVVAKTVGNIVSKTVKKIGAKIASKEAAKEASKEVAKEAGKEASKEVAKEGTKEAAKEAGKEASKKGAEEASKQGTKKAGASAWITAGIAIATTAAYFIKKPNKEQKEACDELQNTMTDAQTSLADAQGDMETYAAEVEEKSNEAEEYNNERNDEIEKQKTEFDMYRRSYDALMEKVNNGETLTDSEKELLKQLVPVMQELGETMNDGIDETTEAVGDIYDEMGTYQEGYDGAAETMGEVEGLTDFAESFDKATQTSCYVQAAAQGLNGANGLTAGGKLCATAGFNIGQWIMGGAAIAAGTTSLSVGMRQQMEWAGKVGTEIAMREATQDFNASTSEIYDERIADYEGYLGAVDDLELEVPDDMEVPDEPPTIPTGDEEGSTTSGGFGVPTTNNGTTGTNSTTNDPNKKDKDPKDKGVA